MGESVATPPIDDVANNMKGNPLRNVNQEKQKKERTPTKQNLLDIQSPGNFRVF